MIKTNVLITGAGGIGGVNFCRALNYTKRYKLIGTDYFKYHRIFPEVARIIPTPKHTSLNFIPTLEKIVKKYEIEFLHPNPTSEALQVAIFGVQTKTLLPDAEVMELAFDKKRAAEKLSKNNILTPEIYDIIGDKKLEFPVWTRANRGAGGEKSLLCYGWEDLNAWLKIWQIRGAAVGDFLIQRYIEGRDVAWDSLWYRGKLITSYARERCEYPFRRVGRGGTPTVAKTICNEKVNQMGKKAVVAIDPSPNGFYCVDFMYNFDEDLPYVTEVNAGKAHTTLALWSYAMAKHFSNPSFNLPDLYIQLGLGHPVEQQARFDLFPENYYLIRHIDCGSWLWKENKGKIRIV